MLNKYWWAGFAVAGGIWFILAYSWDWGHDWVNCFTPAIRAMFSGSSPYISKLCIMNNPPWAYILLSPLTLLPGDLGRAVLALITFISFSTVALKMGWQPGSVLALMFIPQLLFLACDGNLEGLTVLGYILPPWLGLFFVLIKPQIGAGIALFWAVERYRAGGIMAVIRTFAPVGLAYGLAFLVYGADIIPKGAYLNPSFNWNWSLFPVSIPIGMVLLVRSIQTRNKGESIIATPFLSPYVGFYSWPAVLLGLKPSKLVALASVVGAWVVYGFKTF